MKKYAMAMWTIALGLALNLIGVTSWLLSSGASWTPLIPAIVGGLFLVLGGFAFKDKLRKHIIHLALVLALALGLWMAYTAYGELLKEDGSVRRLFAFQNVAISSLIYVAIGIRSFVHARRARRDAAVAVKAAEQAAAAAEV